MVQYFDAQSQNDNGRSVRRYTDLDRNLYEVSIEFYVVNTPTELVDLTLFLERLR